MALATHLIKIEGEFDLNLWNEISLREYVKNKINEIESCLHPESELFQINNNKINIWILICALPSEVSQKIVNLWAENHITEEGLKVKKIEIEIINSLIEPKCFGIILK